MSTERTREQAVRRAGVAYANLRATCEQLTPREQAEQAYHPGGPSIDELEDRIRAKRGMPPINRTKSA